MDFQSGNKAQVSIVKEEADWTESDKVWFFYEPEEKERIRTVMITVPKDSNTPNNTQEIGYPEITNNEELTGDITPEGLLFCAGCGTKLNATWVYCSKCGKKVSDID